MFGKCTIYTPCLIFAPSADVVFLRAWYSVEPRKFYNPVTSLLLRDKTEWRGMRLTGQVRHEESLKTPLDINSAYKVSFHFVYLHISLAHRKSPCFSPLSAPLAASTL
jgi:hypothetical protein